MPPHGSGSGKAAFAALPDDQIDAILKGKEWLRITRSTIAWPQTMGSVISAICRHGWSVDNEELASSTRCVASPVDNCRTAMPTAIRFVGSTSHLLDDRAVQPGIAGRA